MINPLTILSGFSLKTKAFLVLLVFIAGFGAGYKTSDAFQALGEWHSLNQQIKTSEKIIKSGKDAAKQVQKDEADTRIVYQTIIKRIHDENDNRICFADSTALGLWNDAIAGKDTHRPDAISETATIDPVVTTVEEVLANAAENFKACNLNSQKHNALIDTLESLDGKICICSQ